MIIPRVLLVSALLIPSVPAQQPVPANPVRVGADQKKATRINEAIFEAIGFGNAMMVVTPGGNVVIDTSSVAHAARCKELLKAENAGPVKYIILTHAHGDHTGGVPLWMEPGTQLIAQKNYTEFMSYQTQLGQFFVRRNSAQFSLRSGGAARPANPNAEPPKIIEPTILFDDHYEFTLGGVKFELFGTPGETPDHLTVWVPKYRAAFSGDNYYNSFPNMYTLRGTRPRWALEYISSLNKVLDLKPEILVPSHGPPIHGNAEIVKTLTRSRDAISYVHDAVLKGMNDGKDKFTLMREIKLPPDLAAVGESYGRLTWSIRGIYEGYAGWFDGNPATMYETPASAVLPDLVKLAGGPDPVAKLAMDRVKAGKFIEALHLTDAALAADPHHVMSLKVRLQALQGLRGKSRNSNEAGWLDNGIENVTRQLGQ